MREESGDEERGERGVEERGERGEGRGKLREERGEGRGEKEHKRGEEREGREGRMASYDTASDVCQALPPRGCRGSRPG